MELDVISCQLSNMFRKKGTKPRKPADQFQPDYVKDAKEEAKGQKRVVNKNSQKELAEIFEKRNNQVKSIEEKLRGE